MRQVPKDTLHGSARATPRGNCTLRLSVPMNDPRLAHVNFRQSPWYVFSLMQYIIFNLGISQNFGDFSFADLEDGWPFEMVVDWVRVYQDPDNINIGCDTKDYPTKDYIEKHMEAYTNPNLTLWGNTRDEGGYEGDWPLNKLYSKGCQSSPSKFPGDPDEDELIAPVLSQAEVTRGIYTYSDKQPVITKVLPVPGESGSERPTSANPR